MKISFVTTVYNEEKTLKEFLNSLFGQSQLPNEIIIVDGGSHDNTFNILKSYVNRYKNKISIKIFKIKGNRSLGRNFAIKKSSYSVIACSDAGNILSRNWLKNITKPLNDKKIEVVAGYYKAKSKNIFHKCLTPYALVMPDKIKKTNFLPSTRSVAFRKKVWAKVGGFDERYSHNEDYVFANKLNSIKANIFFQQDAKVFWYPRNNFRQAFIMFYRFALGDIEAKIIRLKVVLLISRYLIILYLFFLSFLYKNLYIILFILYLFALYIAWAIFKNYKYVKNYKAIFYLPAIQLTADFAVMLGSILGLIKLIKKFNYLFYIYKSKILFTIISSYVLLETITIKWGIPNQYHPFPYHMDEWHQLGAVGNTYRFGTPNTAGSANGTMLHFILSGVYLGVLSLIKVIDPFSLQIDNFAMREKIFILLRTQTIIYGVLAILLFYKIASFLKASPRVATFLFTFSPIWIMLSGYFKYDIALLFWILLSIYTLLIYSIKKNTIFFILSGIISGLAVSIKISAIPLLAIYIMSYFLFSSVRQYKPIIIGLLSFILTVILFGAPDTIFGKGNLYDYFYTNVISGPQDSTNFILNSTVFNYLTIKHFPVIFGHIFYYFSFICLIIITIFTINKKFVDSKQEVFIILAFLIFASSLVPLKIWAIGNRSLVLLPFLSLFVGLCISKLAVYPKIRQVSKSLITIIIVLHIFESFLWINIKLQEPPQQTSSKWISKNIKTDGAIGIENIPIYQKLPDILVKEFYLKEYKVDYKNIYSYEVINSKTTKFPQFVILTDDNIHSKLFKLSPKNELTQKLKKNKYKILKSFKSDLGGLKFIISDKDFYMASLIAQPNEISIYER